MASDIDSCDDRGDDRVEDCEIDVLVSKKKTKSFVWNYFEFETDCNGRPHCINSPKCRLCQATIAAKDSNTSNLYSHLKSKHPEEYLLAQHASKNGSLERKGQASILDLWKKQQPLSSSLKEHKSLTNSIAYCLARDMLPLSTVDKPGFRAMLHQFNPRYQLPTRKHFTKVAVPALVTEVKGKIEQQIKSKELDYFLLQQIFGLQLLETHI